MNPSASGGSATTTPAPPSTTDEPFFLDWGSSVNVNDDLRHTIQSEIETIHIDITNLNNNIKQEQRTSSQLSRDYSHAQSELIHLSRGANDERDNAIMNEEILSRLKSSSLKEVIGVVEGTNVNVNVNADVNARMNNTTNVGDANAGAAVTITPPRNTHGSGADDENSNFETDQENNNRNNNDDTTTNENNNNNANNNNNNNNNIAMVQDVLRKTHEIKALRTRIESKQADLNECTTQLTQVQYDLKVANHGFEREMKNQSAWNDDVDAKQREWDVEKSRMKNAKDKIYRSRKLTGEYTQQHTNDVSDSKVGVVKCRLGSLVSSLVCSSLAIKRSSHLSILISTPPIVEKSWIYERYTQSY